MNTQYRKKIIVIAGKQGSGKSEVVKICEHSITGSSTIRVSDIFKNTLKVWHLPATILNLRKVADMFKHDFGEDVVSRAVEKEVALRDSLAVIVDGVRGPNVLKMLKQKYDTHLIYVECDNVERFDRIKKRTEKLDDSQISFEEFLQYENYRTEIEVEALKEQAEFVIDNSSNIEQLISVVKTYLIKRDLSTT